MDFGMGDPNMAYGMMHPMMEMMGMGIEMGGIVNPMVVSSWMMGMGGMGGMMNRGMNG